MTALLLALVIGTWNGNWFPSGRAEHRAHPDVEAATTAAAGRMLAEGLRRVDPFATNDVILCLNEIRGPSAASNLVSAIGRANLHVVSVSGYRRRDRFDQQQDVIASTLPVEYAGWSTWTPAGRETPPRGYAFAVLTAAKGRSVEVFAVHLKSNYGATTTEAAQWNAAKRARAAEQLSARLTKKGRRKPSAAVVAGDFNTDKWSARFAGERTFPIFEDAGLWNLLGLLPPDGRGTYPNKRHGDSALDYILTRGLVCSKPPVLVPNDGLSDHYAVFACVDLEPASLKYPKRRTK